MSEERGDLRVHESLLPSAPTDKRALCSRAIVKYRDNAVFYLLNVDEALTPKNLVADLLQEGVPELFAVDAPAFRGRDTKLGF